MRIRYKNRIILGIIIAIGASLIYPWSFATVLASDISVYSNSAQETVDQAPVAFDTTSVTADNSVETVSMVTLSESYHEDYDLYEESIRDIFFIYANVGNGTISSVPVKIDIPANVSYTMEKDGISVTYKSNEMITDNGNYVLRLTAIDGTVTYQTTFRFSIREELAQEDEALDQETEQGPDGISEEDLSSQLTDEDMAILASDDVNVLLDETNEDAEINYSALSDYLKFSESYDETQGLYVETLFSKTIFLSSVPNGIITNDSVSLTLPENITYLIYKNDEVIEVESTEFTEPGSYRIVMSEDSLDYILAYGEDVLITFTFRIVKDAVSDMRIFNVPYGFSLAEVYYEDEPIALDQSLMWTYYKMYEDGSYLFKYTNPETTLSYTTSIIKDTQAPEYSISLKNGIASITYLSTDIKAVSLFKDGIEQTSFSQYKIEGQGDYTITVTDVAGNSSVGNFSMGNAINSATIWAVIIFLLIVAGIFYIVFISKKNISIR